MKVIVFELFEKNYHEALFIDLSLVDENNTDQVAYKGDILIAMKNDNLGYVNACNCFTHGNKELEGIRIDIVEELVNNNDKIVTLVVI